MLSSAAQEILTEIRLVIYQLVTAMHLCKLKFMAILTNHGVFSVIFLFFINDIGHVTFKDLCP